MSRLVVAQPRMVLDESMVRELAKWRGDPVVISLYLDVDGKQRPRRSDYAPHLSALYREARHLAASWGDGAPEAVDSVLAQISEWFGRGLDRHVTRGVAAFGKRGLFELFSLPVPVRDQVAVDTQADIAQLCRALATPAVLVVAVDNQDSRILSLSLDASRDLAAPLDPVERQVDTDVELGSFEHREEELHRQHLRRVAHEVTAALEERPVEALVLSGAPEALAELEAHLGASAAELVVGRMSLGPHAADLAPCAESVVEEHRSEQRRAIVSQLHERVSQADRAVAGLAATLEALGDERTEMVVVEDGLEMPGGRCRVCGRLVASDLACPSCGGAVEPSGNVVAAAVSDAFLHHVQLEFCEPGALADIGRIGAFERF